MVDSFIGSLDLCFSPRNGEIILKYPGLYDGEDKHSFSPRNGEIILKEKLTKEASMVSAFQSPQWGDNSKENGECSKLDTYESFSPRNGEIILKDEIILLISSIMVSVPAMGR